MGNLQGLGRLLVAFGLVIALLGAALLLLGRLGLPRLPGDIVIERRDLLVYVPLASALLLSLLLSLVLSLLFRR